MRWWICACVALTLAACARASSQAPTPTVASVTLSPTPTLTPVPLTFTPTPSLTPTATMTPAPTPTRTPVTPSPTPTTTPTPTPIPTPVGGGGLIAVSAYIDGNWDIYALRVSAQPEQPGDALPVEWIRLTSHPAEDRYPAFSPDGRTLAFASRRDGYWNLYTLTPDGTITQLTDDPAYDGAPAWSPDGERLAFDSLRGGNLDVWMMDARPGSDPVNLTAPDAASGPDAASASAEFDPVWSPDGSEIAFTSWRYEDEDLFSLTLATGTVHQLTSSPAEEHLFGWSANEDLLYTVNKGEEQDVYQRLKGLAADAPGTRLTRWRWIDAPVRSPDGTTLAYLYRRPHGAQLSLHPDGELPIRLTGDMTLAGPLSWTGVAAPWQEARGEPVVLYTEETAPGDDAPYDLKALEGITVGNPWLSDRVDDSFQAMRQRVIDETGHDFFVHLSDAWRAVSFESDGSSYTSWHKAGRAIDTLMDYLSPDAGRSVRRQRWLEVALEPAAGDVYWRLYLRCERQDGSQGMPLKVRPWDVTASARANLRGGRFKPAPEGYYVDLTALMAEYGWLRIAAHDAPDFDWHTNFVALEYWHFQKTDDLPWYEAMLELFPQSVVELHHSWEVQQLKGTPLWLAWAKGVPLPEKERRMMERIAR